MNWTDSIFIAMLAIAVVHSILRLKRKIKEYDEEIRESKKLTDREFQDH